MNRNFTKWTLWENRSTIPGIVYPGIYTLAISGKKLHGEPFKWCREIIYVGMTNAKGGLKSRLGQFDNTIKGGNGHGGAHRVRFKHPNYEKLISKLYVSVCQFPCDVNSERPKDLRIMGEVARYEYECFALFVERFKCLPEFNDKKRSPKK